ncbi:MAG: hypothetical protein ACHQRM_10545 [Bacteroidia bacterium]
MPTNLLHMIAAQEAIKSQLLGGHKSVQAINRCINPRGDAKYSFNLYQFLSHKHKYLTNIFQDSTDGRLYIGLREPDGSWYGAILNEVFSRGSKVRVSSYPSSWTRNWKDITLAWWESYFEHGTHLLDEGILIPLDSKPQAVLVGGR